MKKTMVFVLTALLACNVFAQGGRDRADIPVKSLTLYSSGVGFFEHSIAVDGFSILNIPFDANAVDDALKSLVIYDSAGGEARVSYPSANAEAQGMGDLLIDLSGCPSFPGILRMLPGAKVTVTLARRGRGNETAETAAGRILAVEDRSADGGRAEQSEYWLTLLGGESSGAGEARQIRFAEIDTIRFDDPRLQRDFTRALDMLAKSVNDGRRFLAVELSGTGKRDVSVGYVIPEPVWKMTYRLETAGDDGARLQAWAIVDNDSGTDWDNISLTLRAGRPVSFTQPLYAPYYLSRPRLPLSIAGTADAEIHERAYSDMGAMAAADSMYAPEAAPMMKAARNGAYAAGAMPVPAPVPQVTQGNAAESFDFTFEKPVTVKARSGAMLALADTKIGCKKVLIFDGRNAANRTTNPRLGLELVNSSPLRFPAGPVTIYGGGYSGDALLDYFSAGEKRLISYGEDLSVSGTAVPQTGTAIDTVTVSAGVMTVTRKQRQTREYRFKNTGGETKTLLIEHPITRGASLTSPAAKETTADAYRFETTLAAGNAGTTFTVVEETPIYERVSLVSSNTDTILSYSSNQQIPETVREALRKGIELKKAADAAAAIVDKLDTQRRDLADEEDRLRKNAEASGRDSAQGRQYLAELSAADAQLKTLAAQRQDAEAKAEQARAEYEAYLSGLEIK